MAFPRKPRVEQDGTPTLSDLIEQSFRDQESQLIKFLSLRLGSLAEAQDAAQLTFLRLWQRKHELTGSNLVGLLFITARNISTDILRSRLRRSPVEENYLEEPDDAPSADRILIARQRIDALRAALNELPPKCRLAFVRYKFEEKAYGDIADEMKLTESMVRKYVLKAIAHCALRLRDIDHEA